jgi:hypothetical protein
LEARIDSFIALEIGMARMAGRQKIDQYDLVEIIQVPDQLQGVVDVGDVGVVLEKYNDKNFDVECVQPGGSSKWLATLNVRHLRLRSKDPYNKWEKKSFDKALMQKSIRLGTLIGTAFGALIGAGFGAITMTLNGIVLGTVVGLVLGMVTGLPAAALTVKTAGTTGGIGVGYFTGMVFGGVLGMILGALIPPSLGMNANTQGMPVLAALMRGRFETAILTGFLLSILGTIVGSWVGGVNQVPRDLKDKQRI